MAKIAFILLCHKDPAAIIAQAQSLTAQGDYVAIHFDARARTADYSAITTALGPDPNVTFARKRVKCGWGEWSLVQATLHALTAAEAAFPDASHFYMLSGDCGPVKSAAYARRLLDQADRDYVESFDFHNSNWIKTGFKEERLIYRHFFNERAHKRMFYASLEVQKRLGLTRAVPSDIAVMIGSQWWCLRRRTIEAILKFTHERPDVTRFFSTTWIPDETYFQTLVRHLVPEPEIENRSLTFKMFSDYGMPVTFYNDHYDLLISQDHLFARKISPEATRLKGRLSDLWQSDRLDFASSQEGERLHAFLTGRGRIGKRFGTRFWERESTLGPDRDLYMVVCKKWHVAKRLVHAISERLDIRAVDYLFDEATCKLPPLGGIERTLEKRNRHRRALLRLLYDYHGTERMVICLDPANIDLMADFVTDRANTRILEVQCAFDDAYLVGHARRVGLAAAGTPPEVLAQMLPPLRHAFSDESVRIRDADFTNHWRLREENSVDANAEIFADLFRIGPEDARALADTPYLFDD